MTWLFLLIAIALTANATDLNSLTADRVALERVYYEHQLGVKPPFEEAVPAVEIEKTVKRDLKKEAILKQVYQTEISDADVDGEIQRINSTTKAPEILAEIKVALGNDKKRFGDAFARPLIVERKLRQKFENDDKLHAPQRAQTDEIRKKILAAKEPARRLEILKANKNATEVTWQLGARSAAVARVGNPGPGSPNQSQSGPASIAPAKVIAKSASYSTEATAQLAQVLSAPGRPRDTKHYFEDLEPELQNVLRAQLQKAGDVSAVIETPTTFLLFVAKDKTKDALSVASLTIPKQSYDEWLNQQSERTTVRSENELEHKQ